MQDRNDSSVMGQEQHYDEHSQDREFDPDPMKRAQALSQPVLPKRFYHSAEVVEEERGYSIMLDGRLARTPAKRALSFYSPLVAEKIAEEWNHIGDVIDPKNMPITRIANSAIDGVADDPGAVFDEIVRYAATDLLCYRAGEPEELVNVQNEHWDPILEWVSVRFGARLLFSQGIMHVEQSENALRQIEDGFKPLIAEPLALAAAHVVTSLTGSALLCLGVLYQHLSADGAWMAAHVDEDWQIQQWGEDQEAAKRRAYRFQEMNAAASLLLCHSFFESS